MGIRYRLRRLKRNIKYHLNYYEIFRLYPPCDVCGKPITHTVRYGGLLSDGNYITGPSLWGCNKHLKGKSTWE